MRKVVWLIAFALSALLFGAADSAFAHSSVSAHSAHSTAAAQPHIVAKAEAAKLPGEFVSSFDAQPAPCPHGQGGSDCGFCCACPMSASAAITTPGSVFREDQADVIRVVPVAAQRLRQAVFDLSRPPKSFV